MKVIKHRHITTDQPTKTIDCFVDKGYRKTAHGTLPDVDVDYQSDRRLDVKAYYEDRYNHDGKQRVFSAGTFTTLKAKAVIKDVARTMRISPSLVNYLTAIFEDDNMGFTEVFKLAAKNKKVAKFIHDYPMLFEDIRTLMFQPRSSSIHASALLVTPDDMDGEDMECFDFVPIKKVDGMLVSEDDGYSLDELGLLKNDCLATKELSKLHETIDLVNQHYDANVNMENIILGDMNDAKVYELLCQGFTQNVFQFSSPGMTKYLMSMKPSTIHDLIAANALYRPATLESKSSEEYVNRKTGLVAPTYLWGTYNAMKDTFGVLAYQEELAQIAREVGGFTLAEGVKLVKFISKKKQDKINAMKDKFMEGAKVKGCPAEDACKIWEMFEVAGGYCFNKCIAGYEYIGHANSGQHGRQKRVTIAEMYKTMNDAKWALANGHKSLRGKYQRQGYTTSWSLTDDPTNGGKYLMKNKIKDIRYMGIRPIYRITLANGATIDVTDNHKHPTEAGMKRTDELIVGQDKMYVSIGSLKEDTGYRFTDKDGGKNDEYYHSNDNLQHYEINAEKGHMGFYNRVTEYTKLEYYRQHIMPDYCEKCGASQGRLEIHHVNGDHSSCGEAFSNLQTLCVSCHKKAHYAMGRKKMGEKGLDVALQTVVSVEYVGDDEVYDVEMYDPHHTFINGNGVVTCNSHSTAYAATAYVGAWLKANYPTAFYTIALQWAEDKELLPIMSEMTACSEAKVVSPDINKSAMSFYTDYATNSIFWSLSKIKMLGAKAVEWIINERNKNGEFISVVNFIERVFKYKLKKYEYWDDPDNADEATRCPVNARHVLHLILAGCFDNVEHAGSVVERYTILEKAASTLGFEIKEADFPAEMIGKHYFWSQKQIKVSGLGAIDYKRIYDNSEIKQSIKGRAAYRGLGELVRDELDGTKAAICATIAEIEEKKFTSKKTGEEETFAKITLQQNNDTTQLIIWPSEWNTARAEIINNASKIIVCMAGVKYSDYAGKNELQLTRHKFIEIL